MSEWALWINSPWGRRQNGLLLRGHKGERNNCLSKIQLIGQKYRDKATLAKRDSAAIVLVFEAGATTGL